MIGRSDFHTFIITGEVNNELPKAGKFWKKRQVWKKLKKENKVHSVKKIKLHGGYIKANFLNDIAIITVKEPFKFDHVTKKAPLPSRGNLKNGNDFQIILDQSFEVTRNQQPSAVFF